MPKNPLNYLKVIGRGWFNTGLTLESILQINDWKLFGSFRNFRQYIVRIKHLLFASWKSPFIIWLFLHPKEECCRDYYRGLIILVPLNFQLWVLNFSWSQAFVCTVFDVEIGEGGDRWWSLSLKTTGAAFCVWPTVFPSANIVEFTFCSTDRTERTGSIFLKTEAWSFFSISLLRRYEGDLARLETQENSRVSAAA